MGSDDKLFYSMGQVAEMLDVSPSLLRFWEGKFPQIKPHKNAKGNRLFTPRDVENLKLIYHLVKERGMTLAGAQKVLRGERKQVEAGAQLLERLQTIRSLLVEIRQELGQQEGEVFVDKEISLAEDTISEAQPVIMEVSETIVEVAEMTEQQPPFDPDPMAAPEPEKTPEKPRIFEQTLF